MKKPIKTTETVGKGGQVVKEPGKGKSSVSTSSGADNAVKKEVPNG